MNDKGMWLKFCLVLGSALRNSYRLRRENPRPIVKMIKREGMITLFTYMSMSMVGRAKSGEV